MGSPRYNNFNKTQLQSGCVASVNNKQLYRLLPILQNESQLLQDSGESREPLFPNNGTDAQLANAIGMYSSINHRFWELEDGNLIPTYYSWNGEEIKGSTYLDLCFRDMIENNPDFFELDNLEDFTLEKFHQLLGDGVMPDENERFQIMKDFLDKTVNRFNKDLNLLWSDCSEDIETLHEILNNTEGFRDPLAKKTQMYVKFMDYQGIWNPNENSETVPPLDYHLMNLAIKTGIIKVNNKDVCLKLIERKPLSDEESNSIRESALEAFSIYKKEGIHPYNLDDIFWNYSRTYCQNPSPDCLNCPLNSGCASYLDNDLEMMRSFPVVYTNAF